MAQDMVTRHNGPDPCWMDGRGGKRRQKDLLILGKKRNRVSLTFDSRNMLASAISSYMHTYHPFIPSSPWPIPEAYFHLPEQRGNTYGISATTSTYHLMLPTYPLTGNWKLLRCYATLVTYSPTYAMPRPWEGILLGGFRAACIFVCLSVCLN